MTKLSRALISVCLITPLFAQDDIASLKAQIRQLQQQILQLQKKIAELEKNRKK
jgi:TolA-binding protein